MINVPLFRGESMTTSLAVRDRVVMFAFTSRLVDVVVLVVLEFG